MHRAVTVAVVVLAAGCIAPLDENGSGADASGDWPPWMSGPPVNATWDVAEPMDVCAVTKKEFPGWGNCSDWPEPNVTFEDGVLLVKIRHLSSHDWTGIHVWINGSGIERPPGQAWHRLHNVSFDWYYESHFVVHPVTDTGSLQTNDALLSGESWFSTWQVEWNEQSAWVSGRGTVPPDVEDCWHPPHPANFTEMCGHYT